MKKLITLCIAASMAATVYAGPSIVGSMNEWNPADPGMELTLNANGVWELVVVMPMGNFEYKVVEGDSWGDGNWPDNNQWVNISEVTEEITFYANLGANVGPRDWDEFVTHMNPVVAGNFIGALGGSDWNPGDLTGEMFDGDMDGIFEFSAVVPEGDWEGKVTLNHNWDQNTSPTNIGFHSDGTAPTLITYDMSNNTTTVSGVIGLLQDVLVTFQVDMSCVEVHPDGAWLAGTFTNWGDGELAMYPVGGGIWMLDVLFLEGDAYHQEYKFKNGHDGWEYVDNHQLEIDDSMPTMTLPLVMFNGEDCPPTDLNLPGTIMLAANYPNPFNPTTSIQFALPAPGAVTLTVYNLLGGNVATLANGHFAAGTHIVQFNGADLPSGVYYYTLTGNGQSVTNKMLLIK
ncbi:T9SS type A sorting domain-containing protein [bacterium]|nr:T9SS type A sorting domain-containing protein [bacterium]